MTNYRPLLYGLGSVFILALFMNLIISPFLDLSNPNPDSLITTSGVYDIFVAFLSGYADFFEVTTDLTIFGFSFNIPIISDISDFVISINNAFVGFITTQFTLITYIPDLMLIPYIIILSIALVYGLIKIFIP